MVAAVPLAVPDREALLAEQVGAEGVRGEVDGARLPDQVDDREQQRDEHGREAPPVDAPVPGVPRGRKRARRAKRRVPGATSPDAPTRRRRDCGERGPEHGCRRLAERADARNAGDALHELGPVEPRPVARRPRARARPARRARPRRPGRTRRPMYGSSLGQSTSAGQRTRSSRSPAAREHVGRRRAVELQDRPLGAVVEVLPGLVGQRRRAARAGSAQRVARPIISSPTSGRPPAARHAVPAVAGQERHGARTITSRSTQLGPALREREAHRAPVVHTSESARARARPRTRSRKSA